MPQGLPRTAAMPAPTRRVLAALVLAGLPGRAQAQEADLPVLARALAESLDSELRRVEAALLAAGAALEAAPPNRPPAVPVRLLDRLARGAAGSLGLPVLGFDLQLAQLVHSELPFGVPLAASPAAELAGDALDAERPLAGPVTLPSGGPGLGLAVPVPGGPGQRPAAVLVALLPAEQLAALLAASLAVQAGAGTVVAARLVAEGPAGAPPDTIAWIRPGPFPAQLDLPAGAEPRQAEGHAPPEQGGRMLRVAAQRLRREPRWAVMVAGPVPPSTVAAAPFVAAPSVAAPSVAAPSVAAAAGGLPWLAALGGLAGGVGLMLLLRRRRARLPAPEPPLALAAPNPAEQEARQALAELRAICDTIPVGLALLDRERRLLSANLRLAAFAGLPTGLMVGRPAADVLPPPLAEAIEGAHGQVLREGRPILDLPLSVEAAGTLRHTRNLLVSCHPVRDAGGRIDAVSASVLDITERARAEAGRDLLVHELNHRVKNTLATVQTIAQQTLRHAGEDPSAFARSFGERLRALARAHDLLTANAWSDAELAAVAEAALAPWLVDPRLIMEGGPAVMLRPGQAQALVLGFHELATNAAKYGALTAAEGRVRLRWGTEAEGMVVISWSESGGPAVPAAPSRRGFGTRLLEQALRQDLGADAQPELRFEPAGLCATISFRPGGLPQARRVAA